MALLKNVWFKRGIAMLSVVYSGIIVWLAYMVLMSSVEYVKPVAFTVFISVIFILLGAAMYVSRKQVVTIICSIFNLLPLFVIVVFGWGDWLVVVPAFVVSLFMFFACSMNENAKAVFGTIYLLIYILGGIAFFLLANIFLPRPDSTKTIQGVSPSGLYRYYVLDVSDYSSGRTEIYVEPNTKDTTVSLFGNDMLVFRARGYEVLLKRVRNHNKPVIVWKGDEIYIDEQYYQFEIGSRKIDEKLIINR